jgi:glycosyltransferase involved in cell wall biosynthesis
MTQPRTPPPRVSVVLPTYRRTDLLERAIGTVLSQTETEWELIIVDDNGEGHPSQIAAAAVAARHVDDHRIRYVVHAHNQGGGAARNTGIAHARAPLVAFLDDDDAWYPSKLERQLACFEASPADVALVYGAYRRVSSTGPGRIETPTPDGHSVAALLRRNGVGTTSLVMCRKAALDAIGGFDPTLRSRQDLDLYLRLAQRYPFAYVDAPLLDKHQHEGLAIGKDQEGTVDAHRRFYEKHRDAYALDRGAHHACLKRYGEEVLRTGRTREARGIFWQAWRLQPTSMATLGLLLASRRPVLATYRWIRERLGLRRPTLDGSR